MKTLWWTLGIIASLIVAFLLCDCIWGKTRYFECVVIDHQYKPAWSEVSTTTDSDGHTHMTSTYHPEEYHVFCSEYSGPQVFDCQENSSSYYSHTNGQDVTVITRVGRFTGHNWMPTICN